MEQSNRGDIRLRSKQKIESSTLPNDSQKVHELRSRHYRYRFPGGVSSSHAMDILSSDDETAEYNKKRKKSTETLDLASRQSHDTIGHAILSHGNADQTYSETPRETIANARQQVTDASGQRDVSDILKSAEPILSDEAKLELDKIKNFLEGSDNKLSEDEYKDSVKKILGMLSPKTLAEYKECKIEFIVDHNVSYPTAKRNEKGEWKLKLPTKYEYPFQGMILRCFDEILKVEAEYAKDMALRSQEKWEAGCFLTDRWVEIAARVFQTNRMLGEKYGWKIDGYELAKKYYQDYNHRIYMAFEKGKINENVEKHVLIEKGNKYANKQLLNSIKSIKDVPKIFPSLQPGAYFEEFNIERREIKHKNPPTTFLAAEPIKLGNPSFDTLMTEDMEIRSKNQEIGKNRENDRKATLNVVILPNKEIWVLPYYFQGGERSLHSVIARGNPCAWAGEVIIQGNKVISIKDQSGHYKTYDYCDKVQKSISDFALQTFRDQGYAVPQAVELTVKGRDRMLV